MQKIKAIICDWAGTTVDFGCMAPILVFVEVFKQSGIEITLEEARGPMGLAKKDHIRSIISFPRVQQLWQEKFHRLPTEKDVEDLYSKLEPLLAEVVKQHSELIPGTLELQDYCRSNQIKFGSTTGYVNSMMQNILPLTESQHFHPDCIVTSDEVPQGRPTPWMIYENMKRMQIFPASSIVKIGDTVADIREGVNAGMLTIGLTLSGNETGLSAKELEQLPEEEKDRYRQNATQRLKEAGADFICDGIWDVVNVLKGIS